MSTLSYDTTAARRLLEAQRDRAERVLNGTRLAVLLLLASAALASVPSLPTRLSVVNVLVLTPMIAWSVAQYLLFYRAARLPAWLFVANPTADVSAVTLTLGGYAATHSAALAFKTPMFLAYFAILASRPITTSTGKAAATSALAVLEYGALLAWFAATGRLGPRVEPVMASVTSGISPLDEAAKLLFLLVAGGIATYATAWHERLALSYFRESHEREQIEVRLSQAQLEGLKMQLRPHFLFNTLNTIAGLIAEDPRAAERVVAGLSELLRVSLRTAGEQEVPLAREISTLRAYLSIQQVRFQDRLRVEIAVAPDAHDALVPNLLLQPLVENAIQHGIAPRAAPGCIQVRSWRDGDTLHLQVRDDGVGPPGDGASIKEGVGLGNARARLERLYGPRYRFEARGVPGAGFTARITIPYRSSASEASLPTHATAAGGTA